MNGPDSEKYAAGLDYMQDLGLGNGSRPQPHPAARAKGLTKSCVLHQVHMDQDRDSAEEWSFVIMLRNCVLEIVS